MTKKLNEMLSRIPEEMELDIKKYNLSEQEMLSKWTARFLSLNNEYRDDRNESNFQELLSETVKEVVTPNETSNLFSCVPTGFADLDRIIGGLPLGELIILGARPAMGKSAFMVSIMINSILNKNSPIAFFSLENSAQYMLLRMLSNIADCSYHHLVSKKLEEYQLQEISRKSAILETANLTIEDTFFSLDDIISRTDFLVREKGIQLIIIDYLQLIRTRSRRENREMEIATICRELKRMARKYNVAVFVSSQLSRAVETRGGDKRPVLSDLRESGAIEQDADKVFFLHRPEYYNITEDGEGNSTLGIADIIIAKNRSGPLDTVRLRFTAKSASFKDYEETFFSGIEGEFFKDMRKNEFNTDLKNRGSKSNDIEEDHPF
ncbi:MAG: DnaB-like helicase C-terminal domain-containing protein [Bacteroidota bacterium]